MATKNAQAKLGFLEICLQFLLVFVIFMVAQTRGSGFLDRSTFEKCHQKICLEAKATNRYQQEAKDVLESVKKSTQIA